MLTDARAQPVLARRRHVEVLHEEAHNVLRQVTLEVYVAVHVTQHQAQRLHELRARGEPAQRRPQQPDDHQRKLRDDAVAAVHVAQGGRKHHRLVTAELARVALPPLERLPNLLQVQEHMRDELRAVRVLGKVCEQRHVAEEPAPEREARRGHPLVRLLAHGVGAALPTGQPDAAPDARLSPLQRRHRPVTNIRTRRRRLFFDEAPEGAHSRLGESQHLQQLPRRTADLPVELQHHFVPARQQVRPAHPVALRIQHARYEQALAVRARRLAALVARLGVYEGREVKLEELGVQLREGALAALLLDAVQQAVAVALAVDVPPPEHLQLRPERRLQQRRHRGGAVQVVQRHQLQQRRQYQIQVHHVLVRHLPLDPQAQHLQVVAEEAAHRAEHRRVRQVRLEERRHVDPVGHAEVHRVVLAHSRAAVDRPHRVLLEERAVLVHQLHRVLRPVLAQRREDLHVHFPLLRRRRLQQLRRRGLEHLGARHLAVAQEQAPPPGVEPVELRHLLAAPLHLRVAEYVLESAEDHRQRQAVARQPRQHHQVHLDQIHRRRLRQQRAAARQQQRRVDQRRHEEERLLVAARRQRRDAVVRPHDVRRRLDARLDRVEQPQAQVVIRQRRNVRPNVRFLQRKRVRDIELHHVGLDALVAHGRHYRPQQRLQPVVLLQRDSAVREVQRQRPHLEQRPHVHHRHRQLVLVGRRRLRRGAQLQVQQRAHQHHELVYRLRVPVDLKQRRDHGVDGHAHDVWPGNHCVREVILETSLVGPLQLRLHEYRGQRDEAQQAHAAALRRVPRHHPQRVRHRVVQTRQVNGAEVHQGERRQRVRPRHVAEYVEDRRDAFRVKHALQQVPCLAQQRSLAHRPRHHRVEHWQLHLLVHQRQLQHCKLESIARRGGLCERHCQLHCRGSAVQQLVLRLSLHPHHQVRQQLLRVPRLRRVHRQQRSQGHHSRALPCLRALEAISQRVRAQLRLRRPQRRRPVHPPLMRQEYRLGDAEGGHEVWGLSADQAQQHLKRRACN
ncbi:uncharacterized protein BcabD6B2_30610 [Babesia caballi]|uniref:Uncharacterized protein n=1 Tax=Babesia caballi TaxID=5871 RepID=A0AAV4LWX1_BABCB|nr:hypothetical protein BcabD6B2_30610 [Babesia caballi]